MLFRFRPLRFSFIAREPIHFPPGHSANTLRGAFGTVLRRLTCNPECTNAITCPHRATCPYARFFQPSALTHGPSSLADQPRPFVFRASHLDGRTFAPGEPFHFDLNLFDTNPTSLTYLDRTFTQLAHEGLGPKRRKVELVGTVHLSNRPFVEFDLTAPTRVVSDARIQFITPTELKSNHELAPRPAFAILAARIRDRISTLRHLYGDGPLPIDFAAFAQRASHIQMTRCQITHVEAHRHSTRTGQTHPLGGFVGEAEYHGALTEFIPYLQLAQWTGVGRQTAWGKGAIKLDEAPAQNQSPD